MATTKKTVSKKPAAKTATAKTTTRKTQPAKKPVAKKPLAKKVSRPQSSKAPASSGMRSFKLARDTQSFTSFAITRQTIYWIILIAFIIFAQLWILKLQIEVAGLIDAQQAQLLNF